MRKLPHEGVYTRIKPSNIHGVGVFAISDIPKGTYVFEYATRVSHRGQYQSGMAKIQCQYAPAINSHSQSFAVKVE